MLWPAMEHRGDSMFRILRMPQWGMKSGLPQLFPFVPHPSIQRGLPHCLHLPALPVMRLRGESKIASFGGAD